MSTIPSPIPKPGRTCISGQTSCGYLADQVFECDQCHQEVCYCQGGSDEFPDSCANCVAHLIIIHVAEETHADQEKTETEEAPPIPH